MSNTTVASVTSAPSSTPTRTMSAAAYAKGKVAEMVARESAKPKGPTLGEWAKNPRPIMMRGGRDVS